MHTPGPWSVEDPMGDLGILSIVADGHKEVYEWTHIAQVSTDDDHSEAQGITSAECEANARLIAAAPDLYEALKDAVSAIASLDGEALGVETVERNGQFSVYWVRDELLSKARAALSKVSQQQGSPQAPVSQEERAKS